MAVGKPLNLWGVGPNVSKHAKLVQPKQPYSHLIPEYAATPAPPGPASQRASKSGQLPRLTREHSASDCLNSWKSREPLPAARFTAFFTALETQEFCATVARPYALARPAESSASPALSRATGCAGCQKCRARCAAVVSIAGSSAPYSSRPL
eukprot:scaffold11066_cov62-Phaeocystis_antarctica.AAC.2